MKILLKIYRVWKIRKFYSSNKKRGKMIKSKLILITIFFASTFIPNFIYAQEDLDTAINKLADKISQHMAEKEKTKIAVIPFQDLKTDMITTLGKYIAEELTTALFNSGKFHIMERNLLNKVLDELKLSQTGAVDSSSAKELGKITGVDAVVTGTIQDLITRVAVNCRLIETETGNIFAAASEKILKDETISKLMEEVIELPKAEKEKIDEEKEIEGPRTYDANRYIIDQIFTLQSKYDRDISFRGGWFRLEFVSITIDEYMEVKVFFVNPYYAHPVAFDFPKIVDDEGNNYLSSKIKGKMRQTRCNNGKCFKVQLPGNGRVPFVFEFPFIPKTVNKIWFTLNDQSIEIDWQYVLKKPLNN